MSTEFLQKFTAPAKLGRKTIVGRFVIPSGIRCTYASIIARTFEEVPSIGIITTKSTSVRPRLGNREPIYVMTSQGSYLNAVGLANSGAHAFRQQIEKIHIPSDKFLLVSIFGADASEFAEAARILEPIADGFELNMSCPHADGLGRDLGKHGGFIGHTTRAVVDAIDSRLPVFAKLAGDIDLVAANAEAAIAAGAAGITAINTTGPGLDLVGDEPSLTKGYGGQSGAAIRPQAQLAVDKIRRAIGEDKIIIGMGGISESEHVRTFGRLGADFFGVGSAITGMDLATLKRYFADLEREVVTERRDPAFARRCAARAEESMEFTRCALQKKTRLGEGLYKLALDDPQRKMAERNSCGRFYFLSVPGMGEKPFAVFSKVDSSFVVKTRGEFTRQLNDTVEETNVFVRGPYGRGLPTGVKGRTLVLVGGGVGIAPFLEIAEAYRAENDIVCFFGGRTRDEVFELEKFRDLCPNIHVATDDGTLGVKGFVTDLLAGEIARHPLAKPPIFIVCGPEPMVLKSFAIAQEYPGVTSQDVWGSIEYQTSCGVGICGNCATPSGLLTCVDGPFCAMDEFVARCPKER